MPTAPPIPCQMSPVVRMPGTTKSCLRVVTARGDIPPNAGRTAWASEDRPMVSPEAQSPPRFPRLDPIEHFLGVAISREYRIEDLLHEAVSHNQGETLQEGLSAGFEGGEPQRLG